jgi:hypothetical protein
MNVQRLPLGFARFTLVNAGIAQLVEQLICNQQVVGSNPTAGSQFMTRGLKKLTASRSHNDTLAA